MGGAEADEACTPGEALNAGRVEEWLPVLEIISLEMLSSNDFFFSTSSSLALVFLFCSFCFLLWTPTHTETVSNTPTKTPRSNPLEVIVVDKYTFSNPTDTYEVVSECHVLDPRWASPPVAPSPTDGHTRSWGLPFWSTHDCPLPILYAVEDACDDEQEGEVH